MRRHLLIDEYDLLERLRPGRPHSHHRALSSSGEAGANTELSTTSTTDPTGDPAGTPRVGEATDRFVRTRERLILGCAVIFLVIFAIVFFLVGAPPS